MAGPREEKGLGKVGDGPTPEVGVVDEAEVMLWSECLLWAGGISDGALGSLLCRRCGAGASCA